MRQINLQWLIVVSMLLVGCSQTAPTQQTVAESTEPALPTVVVPQLFPAQQQQFEQAVVLIKQQDYASAEALLLPLSQQQPAFAGIWYNLAMCQWHSNELANAELSLNQALVANVQYLPAHNLLGILARQQGHFQQAERHWLSALEAGNDAQVHKNLGMLYELYLGQPLQAHYQYSQYFELTQDQQAKVWLALLEQELDSASTAEQGTDNE